MICPYCQQDLDPVTLSCPRCGAAYPGGGGGAVLGFRLRTLGVVFVLLVISSLMLVDCVLHHLPRSAGQHGADAEMTAATKQAGAMRALLMMQQHQQANENTPPPPPRR